MKKALSIGIVLVVGVTTLAGYFFKAQLNPVLGLLFQWGLILLAAAGLIGIAYLFITHFRRVSQWQKGAPFSLIAMVAFLVTLVAGLALSPQHPLYRNLILNVQTPVEASLLALIAVSLLSASLRLIRARGWTPMSIAFLASAIFSLVFDLGWIWFPAGSLAALILDFLERLPLIGARGVLLGMALGGLVVGLRFLFALDRRYGE